MQICNSRLSVAVTIAFLLSGCQSSMDSPIAEPEQGSPVDFSGSWEMDYALSERADTKIRYKYLEALALERQRNGRFADRRRGPGLTVDLTEGNSRADNVVAMGQLAEEISRADVLTIRQSEEEIVIERADDFSLVCRFGRAESFESSLGEQRCFWHGNRLVFDIVLPEGLLVRHILILSDNRARLSMSTTLDHRSVSGAFSLNRVYMPFEPGQGQYECEFSLATLKTCSLGASQ